MGDIIYGLFRVLVELFFVQTTKLLLRPFPVEVVPWFSWLPIQKHNGKLAIQEYAAVVVGMTVWALAVAVAFGLSR